MSAHPPTAGPSSSDHPAPYPANGNALFEEYVKHATASAQIARQACLNQQPLLDKIMALEAQCQAYQLGLQEAEVTQKTLQRQVASGDNIIYTVLDGDGCIFNRQLVQRGRDGGREAAKLLVSKISEFAESQGVHGQLTVVINVYVNKHGLAKTLQDCGITSETTFSSFLQGFNSAHALIQVTDVGAQKEAADDKISASIRLFSKLPSCKLVLAGTTHDGGYAHLFSSLETESAERFSKITLLKSYEAAAFEIKRMGLKEVMFEGLFEATKLNAWAKPQAQAPATPGASTATGKKMGPSFLNGGGATPIGAGVIKTPKTAKKEYKKEQQIAAATEALGKLSFGDSAVKKKLVKLTPTDPTKPLSKQSPPCCNQHYLAPPCWHSAEECKYSHFYALTPKQLVQLRQDAKKSPCANALKGKPCREDCFAGHVCPRGDGCRYQQACRFSQPGMHPPGTLGRKDGAAWRGPDGPDFGVKKSFGGYHVNGGRGSGGGGRGESSDEEDDPMGGSGFETESSLD